MKLFPYTQYNELCNLDDTQHDKEVVRIIDMLKEKTPFAFVKFNDGEMMGVANSGVRVARQDQLVTDSLHEKLIQALKHKQENYWIGLPCPECFLEHSKLAESYVGDYEYKTTATVTTNRNWLYFIREFPSAVADRQIFWVSGDDQDLDVLEDVLELPIYSSMQFPNRESWNYYEEVSNYNEFESGDVVCLSCGPMSRVLAQEWFEKRPDVTFLDMGSTLDPFTRQVYHSCHKGWLETGFNQTRRCEGCN
tara:strand:+ start:202 stop:951 length:750 start_codon:yes stop_codon:yes gene_type:complete